MTKDKRFHSAYGDPMLAFVSYRSVISFFLLFSLSAVHSSCNFQNERMDEWMDKWKEFTSLCGMCDSYQFGRRKSSANIIMQFLLFCWKNIQLFSIYIYICILVRVIHYERYKYPFIVFKGILLFQTTMVNLHGESLTD